MGTRLWLARIGAAAPVYIAYTCLVVTLLYWYTVMLALSASIERRQNTSQV